MAIGDQRYPGVLFGDDEWGTMVDKMGPYPGNKGMQMIKLLIKPHPDLVEAYPEILKDPFLQKISTPIGNAIWMEYPWDWVDDPNTSLRNRVIRIKCAFDGTETYYTNQVRRYVDQYNHAVQDMEILKTANAALREKIKDLLDDQLVIATKEAELYNIMKGKSSGQSSDETQENSQNQGGTI